MRDLSINDLRKYLCWCFGFQSLLILLFPFRRIVSAIHRHYALLALPSLLNAAFFSVTAAILAVAWWAVWKGKPSARGWGIAASLTCFLIFFHPDIFPARSIWRQHVGALVIGTLGTVAFLRRDEQHDPSKNLSEPADSGLGGPRL
jgi:hypothetical protein